LREVFIPCEEFEYELSTKDCGIYSAKAVAHIYKKSVLDSRGVIQKITGIATPRTVVRILEDSGIESRVMRVRKTSWVRKIGILIRNLDQGNPVILLVGSGVKDLVPHWITVLGYTSRTNGQEALSFFVYSSSTSTKIHEVPSGNCIYSGQELIHIWSKLRWTWPWMDNVYIQIAKPSASG